MEWFWSFGIYNLRLSDGQFWRLTLKEFVWLTDRYRDEQEILDRRIGRICAMLAEPHRDKAKKSEPFTEMDFVPGKGKAQTVDEQKAILSRIGVK